MGFSMAAAAKRDEQHNFLQHKVAHTDFVSSKTKTLQMGNTASENLVVFLCWELSAQGISKNMVGNCVMVIFMDLCLRSMFTCSVTVWGL